MKSTVKFWTTIIVGGLAINLLFNWLESRGNTNDPPHPKTPQLESEKSGTNGLVNIKSDPGAFAPIEFRDNGKTVLRLETNWQIVVYGKLIGTINTNACTFVPVPVIPGFNEGIQVGIMAAKRNPDVRDVRVLIPVAMELWESVKGGKP